MAIIINGRGRVGARVTTGGSSGGGTDADAQAFITAASITDPTQISAVNTLVTGLKSNNLWTKMKAIYPVVGGNATAHSYNLVNTTQYQLSFSSGWTHSSTGMLPNGTSAYANTGLSPSSELNLTSSHFSLYSRTNAFGSNYANSGIYDGGNKAFNLYLKYYNGKRIAVMYTENNTYADGGVEPDSRGLFLGTRISSNDIKLYKNGSVVGSNTNTETGGILPTSTVYLSAANTNGSPNGVTYDNKELAFCTIGLGLDSTESTTLSTIINAFNTTLGRNTY